MMLFFFFSFTFYRYKYYLLPLTFTHSSALKIFAPLKSKFVSSVATFAEVCLAVIRVPGLEDVTEGEREKGRGVS